jgi:homocysteine S-methyltransferase
MGTSLLARRPLVNRSLDELNLSLPALVRDVHREFLAAGAEIIQTNTFGANRARLGAFGFADRVRAVNLAGVRIAREAARETAFVAGAVGPLGVRIAPWGTVTADEARALFREQIDALVAGGVDLLVLETFQSVDELEQAAVAARESAGAEIAVIAQVSVEDDGLLIDGTAPEDLARRMDGWAVDGIGVNCSTGPRAVLEALERMTPYTEKALCAMPSAGLRKAVSAEYLARYAARFLRAGVRIVGGCCGVTPEHIRAVAEEVRDFAGDVAPRGLAVERAAAVPSDEAPLAERSGLGRKLSERQFVTLVEMAPPVGADASREIAAAKGAGVDAVAVTDQSRRLRAMAACSLLERQGIETMLVLGKRARSPIELQSELLGAQSAGIRNVLCSNAGEVEMVRRLNRGMDLGGHALGSQTSLAAGMLGSAADGAEYIVTRPLHDAAALEELLRGCDVPVIVGLQPLRSVREAEYAMHELGLAVPAETIARLSVAGARAPEEGMAIARELLERVRGMAAGVLWTGIETTELH